MLVGVLHVTLFSWELSQGWSIQDGLSPMSAWRWLLAGLYYSRPCGISSSRASLFMWPLKSGLFFPWYWLPRGQIWKLQSPFWLRPGSHPVSLLPYSISQSKSKGQPWSKEGEIDSTSCWEKDNSYCKRTCRMGVITMTIFGNSPPVQREVLCQSSHLRENPRDRKKLLKNSWHGGL